MIANYCFGGEFRKAYVNLHMRKFLLKTFRRSVFVTRGENHKNNGGADGQNLKRSCYERKKV